MHDLFAFDSFRGGASISITLASVCRTLLQKVVQRATRERAFGCRQNEKQKENTKIQPTMPPKKKGQSLSKKDKNDKSTNNNNDNSTEWDNLDNLSIEQAITMLSNDHQKSLRERINVQKEFETMYQSFYESMKQNVAKMEMKIKAKEMEIEDTLNDQSAEIQVYNEKQQFIQYDHEQNLKNVDEDRMELIKDEQKDNELKLSQNEASQIALKMESKERGIVYVEEVKNTKERFKQESEEAQKEFNLQLETLQQDCLIGHESTQEALKMKAKDESNKMKEMNRKHLEELNRRQEETYKDTEKYFTTVSKQNTANIQRLLEECDRTDKLICDYNSQSLSLEEENERLSEPLSKYLRTVRFFHQQVSIVSV